MASLRLGTKSTCRTCEQEICWLASPAVPSSYDLRTNHWYHVKPGTKDPVEFNPKNCQFSESELREKFYSDARFYKPEDPLPEDAAARHKRFETAQPVDYCNERIQDSWPAEICNRRVVEDGMCGTHLRFARKGARENEEQTKKFDADRYLDQTLTPILKELNEVWGLKGELEHGYRGGERGLTGRVTVEADRLLEMLHVTTKRTQFDEDETGLRRVI